MDFTSLFIECLAMWPPVLDISDGVIYHDNESFYSNHLAAAWNAAELQAEASGEWHSLMIWILYKKIHAFSRKKFVSQNGVLSTELLNEHVTLLKTDLLKHLNEPGYEDMLITYQRNNS
jgi:hypothetical protein